MALLKACTVMEQNANTINGIQVDTSIYVGTGAAGVPTIRVGREAPVYLLSSLQTAVTLNVILDTVNAYAGAGITLRSGTAAFGTSIIQVRNASTGGTVISTSSGQADRDLNFTFDGTQWR